MTHAAPNLRREMFEGFEQKRDAQARKTFAASTSASILIYGFAAGLTLFFAREAKTVVQEKPIDVSFRPPPPPPPVKAEPPPAPAQIVPKRAQVKKVAAPQPIVVPKQIPAEKPPEADPKDAMLETEGEVGDSLSAGGAAVETPPPRPPPPAPKTRVPINLPENATPPVAASGNLAPEYPAAAREKGLEGQVILKIVVSEKGAVVKVEVLRGEEPFAGAAVAAVRTWKYSPAIVGGEPAAVYRIVKVPFRLK